MKFSNCAIFLVVLLLSGYSDAETPSCHSCDTLTDPACGLTLSGDLLSKTKPCADKTKGCFTELYDITSDTDKPGKYVRRGCVSELVSRKCETPNVCEVCNDAANCNKAQMPETRPKCLIGLDKVEEACAILPLNADSNGCVTVYNDDSTFKDRRCLTDLTPEIKAKCIDEKDYTCSWCRENDLCNTENKWSGNYCYSCSGKECNEPSDTSLIPCMAGSPPKSTACQTKLSVDGSIVRKCLGQEEPLCKPQSNCVFCEGLKCNKNIYPAGRLTCIKCLGQDCFDALKTKTATCDTYKTVDQCVTTFNDDGSLLQKSCLSELTDDKKTVCNSGSNINCIKCDGNDCNTAIERIGNNCYTCDGAACLQLIVPTGTCLKDTEGKSDCLTEINENGDLVKKCKPLSATCLPTKSCEICSKNLCNDKKVYPVDRLTCHKCLGNSCSTPSVSNICEKFVAGDTCATLYDSDGSVIQKACLSELTSAKKDTCNDSDDFSCNKCEKSDCNENLKREGNKCYQCEGPDCLIPALTLTTTCLAGAEGKSTDCYTGLNGNGEIVRDCQELVPAGRSCKDDGTCEICTSNLCNKEIYPVDRLACHKCEGASCASETSSSFCLKHDPQNKCVTTFKEDGTVSQKACHSELSLTLQSLCDSTSPDCKSCDTKDCNALTTNRDGNNCYKCEGKDCLDPKTQVLCLGGSTGKSVDCYSDINANGDIVRDCKNDIPDLVACLSSKVCKICSEELCNNKIIPEGRLKCHKCIGTACLQTPASPSICDKYVADDQCVTYFNDEGEVLQRSCYSELSEPNKVVCNDATNINCIKSTDSENTQTSRVGNNCYKCEGEDCVTPKSEHSTVCLAGLEKKSTSCYTGINANGVIIRDCQKDITEGSTCLASSTCEICDSNLCNNGKYPKTQLSCHQCEGEACLQPTVPAVCTKIDVDDVCVTIYDETKLLRKGCLSSLSEAESTACKQNAPSCVSCNSDGCNSANTREEIKCIKCNSLMTLECAQNPSQLTAITCQQGGQCLSKINAGNTIRDCIATSNLETCTGKDCSLCTENSCNNKIYPENRLTCFQCEDSSDCRNMQKEAANNYPCLKYVEDDSCVTIKSSTSTSRKCQSDIEMKCDQSNNCTSCKGNGCNKNNSSFIQANTVLLTIFFVISCNIFKSF